MSYRVIVIISLFLVIPALAIAGDTYNPLPEYSLEISFDIPSSKIKGFAKINVHSKELSLHIGNLKINEVTMNEQKIEFYVQNGVLKAFLSNSGSIAIRYEGIFNSQDIRDTNYGVSQSIVDERGISLTGLWYPQIEGLCRYNLKVILPAGYEAISEAEEIKKTIKDNKAEFIFEFPHPVDGINLIATNRYQIIKDRFNDTEIYAYFFYEDIGIAKTYIEYTKKYLRLYERLIGRYPYKRFSIVENFLPTGYSMPTYTLLGQDVVRLPFIVETSLGHEILHQWFGNLVYIDYDKGNWAEGITTYLADHLYEEQKGKGWEYRKQMMIDYMSYVTDRNEFPLKEFKGRVDFSSKAIGYGKTAMVFHMLKNIVGEDMFYKALRNIIDEKRFQKASWIDLQHVFEKNFGKELGWFFQQWIDKKGIPDLHLENVKARQNSTKFEVSFNIIQKADVYALDVPVIFYGSHNDKRKYSFRIDKEINSLKILLDYEPERVVMDEDYDIARRLSNEELPPVIARLLSGEQIIMALPISNRDAYKGVIQTFKEKGGMEKEAVDIKGDEIKSLSIIAFGNDNPIIGRLFGKIDQIDAGFSVTVKNNPWNSQKVVGIVSAKSKEESDRAFRKIFHYGKYSTVSFDDGKNIYKKTEETARGIKMELKEQSPAVDVSSVKTLSDVIEAVSDKKIIYVGEFHDRFSHHDVQLQVIKGLYRKNEKIAIGMEMFQRHLQFALDDYIGDRITEREFLKKSEYFKRWGFDYNLYKPILDFAKAEKIPIVALNIQREIVNKVSSGGIDSLSDAEKQEIPPQTDFSDNEYRERLKPIFQMHSDSKDKNFDFFYQSQILWDETMSQSIDDFLKRHPDYQMVVLAGSGHLTYDSGIPKRTFRRNGYNYAVILNNVDIDKKIANYVIFPKPIDGITAPKLMALLKEDNGKVVIAKFPENSVSEKAGLKKGDVIISMDNIAIKSVDDVRIHLFYKKKGDAVKVKVMRKRFLFGDKEMEFDVIL